MRAQMLYYALANAASSSAISIISMASLIFFMTQ
jgi:hypothetical protein